MRLYLIGNPNAGKTTIFNALTGSRQHIGNFPGITVEFKQGFYEGDEITDLPGLYSLIPRSDDEAVAVRFLKERPPDVILNCVDMTNLRRSLFLTLSLMELGIPMILIANMEEECASMPDYQRMERQLGLPVFPAHGPLSRGALMGLARRTTQKPPLLCRGTAEAKYHWIDRHISYPVRKKRFSDRLDRWLMHPLWGTVLFLSIMAGIFDLTFRRIGPPLTAFLTGYPERLSVMAEAIPLTILRLLAQGILAGLGSIISFLPMMLLLFGFLALLEDSGYMVRICYLAEHWMEKLGLSGKSIVPLLLGLGCSVPAVLSARTLEHHSHRGKTIRLIPFFSCSAKLPIFSTLAAQIAPEHAFEAVFCTYLLGIGIGFLMTALSKREYVPFMMELPPYRFPRLKNLWFRIFGQISAFAEKAFTVLLVTAILTVFLEHCTPSFTYTDDPAHGLLAQIAAIPAPLFHPTGLDHWILIAALIAGLFAKESVVSVLFVLSPDLSILAGGAAVPFLVFCLLYPPCVTALVTVGKETHSARVPLLMAGTHLLLAYLGAVFTHFFYI